MRKRTATDFLLQAIYIRGRRTSAFFMCCISRCESALLRVLFLRLIYIRGRQMYVLFYSGGSWFDSALRQVLFLSLIYIRGRQTNYK